MTTFHNFEYNAKGLDSALHKLNFENTSIELKKRDSAAIEFIQSVDKFLNTVSNHEGPVFNKTQRYQELKRKKYLSALSKLEKKKEEEKKIMDLFSHSSKNSKNYIDPSMFQDQTIKKILKCNKRAFGVPGSDKKCFQI